MIVKNSRIILIPLLLAMLSACGPVKTPPISEYVISSPARFPGPPSPRTGASLLVATPIASPGYDSAKMIYVQVPYKLRSFATHRWVASPAQMLLPMIAQSIRHRGYFRAVVTQPFAGSTKYMLSLNLLSLQQEFFQPTSQVRLIMQATLSNSQTGRVIASRRFLALVPAPENNPYSGVVATNQAAAKMSRDIADFVIRHV